MYLCKYTSEKNISCGNEKLEFLEFSYFFSLENYTPTIYFLKHTLCYYFIFALCFTNNGDNVM